MTTTLWEHALGSVLLKDNVFLKDSHVDQHRAMRYESQVMGRPKMIQREIKHVSVTKFSPLLKDLYFSDEGIPLLPRISMGQEEVLYACQSSAVTPHSKTVYVLMKMLVPACGPTLYLHPVCVHVAHTALFSPSGSAMENTRAVREKFSHRCLYFSISWLDAFGQPLYVRSN